MHISDFDLLLEGAGDYEAMCRPFIDALAETPEVQARAKEYVAAQIRWVRTVLRRSDRGIWFMRFARLAAIDQMFENQSNARTEKLSEIKQAEIAEIESKWKIGLVIPSAIRLEEAKRLLEHYMGLTSCLEIQSFRFANQPIDEVFKLFGQFEKAWKQIRGKELVDENAIQLIKFHDGMAWYDLEKSICPNEGDAMGHCGNHYGWQEGDTILSLRRPMGGNRVRPSLTFILDRDGYLGEMKGRENTKPNPKYHAHILALLENPVVKGIKGGGHDPDNNFELKDLTEEQRKELFKVRPDLMPAITYLGLHGCDEKFRLKVIKELAVREDERPSEGYSPKWIERDGDWILSFKQVKDWVDFLEEIGDSSIRDAVTFPDSYSFEDYVSADGSDLPKSFPDQWQDALITYFAREAPHSMVNEFFNFERAEEINYLGVEDICEFLSDKGLPRELKKALDRADVEASREGCREAIHAKLKTLCDLDQMHLDPFDDGYFWCTPKQAALWASGATSDDIAEHSYPSFPDEPSFYLGEYDTQVGLDVFFDLMDKDMGLKKPKLKEAHHSYERNSEFRPIKRGDTLRVFHGFRETSDALKMARSGISGGERVGRVYSYESDNNPKGLFVTLNMKTSEQFVGSFGTRTIVEFNALSDELEAPVWPGGSYTVQGQMAQYFGHGAEGRRKRLEAQRNARHDARFAASHIRDSDDPALAMTLTANSEMQALFIGHLDPARITCFWVEEGRDNWKSYSREDYLKAFEAGVKVDPYNDKHLHYVFTAGENFEAGKFLKAMRAMGGADVESTLERIWLDVLKAPRGNRARRFLSNFGMFLWPKQQIPCMQWMAQRWGRNIAE